MSKKFRYEYSYSRKHRLVALILCAMFGAIGLHYLYVRRYWRMALNMLLMMALTIASNVFGIYYIQITFGPTTGIFVHWREAVAVVSALMLGLTVIFDFVSILRGKFRDYEGKMLR